ncbi:MULTISPECIES: NHLP family bacteriocin export ABC transporter peptidase/permease/ATPase subunit [unclassified Chelatococcus]|uniref:NHLP family bacteriocin export ABC transporter peptidase/permease/ATPase subunit n=1 Tax=unclassified Chelatococcus TaxID=2638111 RepID=UPI001BCDD7A9|nr:MULTISPECIES: NHLP family bacteriocin export ABC transporter peptidase/permease/ATPase subunit [unclassified Chelatococcus]CAH1655574.1 ABC transporter [Hyphomicrobiales bacterium]MBS7742590.1 NHLP family bacteriocin export ABC transporter peptidase/permease/ATPase subunit [Chelatococcus sp. HY11]MBX3542292.1 NHLP family bacteriocin export ABC transporter peptidase/permease/ATPase subunit [Chelatococcus sp.]MCO5075490.1 NHLP family bacteriocin export ABC transporter peptidase/permease/ATPase
MSQEQQVRFTSTPRVSVPTVLQMEAVECGAACLAMILAHYGRWVPLEDLRVACGVSRDGSKAKNLLLAARSFGLTAEGWRVEPSSIGQRRLPAILFWDFNHFVVLEGVGRHKVYLNDPASGPRSVTHEEFNNSFTGVMLTMEPGPDFQRGGNKPRVWKPVLDLLANSKAAIAFLAIAGIAALLPGIFVPAATKIFVDEILVNNLGDWLRPLLLGLVFAAIMRGILSWLEGYFLGRLQWKLGTAMGVELTWHVLRLPPRFFAQRYAGDVAARLQSAEQICALISSQVSTLFVSGLAAVFYAWLMALYDPLLATIGILLAALNAVFMRSVARWQENAVRGLLREQAGLSAVAINGIQSIETLKANASEDDFFSRWAATQARVMNAMQAMQVPAQLLNLVPGFLNAVATAAILGVGGFRVMDGIITVGTLAAFQSLLASFSGHVKALVGIASSTRELRGNLERVNDVMRYPLDERWDARPANLDDGGDDDEGKRLSGAVAVRDLVFGYNPLSPPLIENFNLSIAPGARVALVGRSGSGKSTIARMLVGLAEPWSGDVLFDGRPARNVDPAVRALSLGFVDQNIVLMDGSVRQNLALWDPDVTEASLVNAARDADIHDVIASRRGGYDGAINEGASNWSGGQAQRLEIARALVREPSILVFDEATSALDAATEARILENLRRRGCSLILVTHRLSAIRDSDEIIVLDKGKVVERGTHDELWAAGGPYVELIRAA